MFERFTDEARAVALAAPVEAGRRGEPTVGTQHLLLALVRRPGPTRDLLVAHRLDTATIDRAIDDFARAAPSAAPAAGSTAGVDADALAAIGIDLDQVRRAVEDTFGAGALHRAALSLDTRRPPGRLRRLRPRRARRPASRPEHAPATRHSHTAWNPRAKKALELSLREAIRLKQHHIGAEHIALGLLREGEGLACRILLDAGLDLAVLRRSIEDQARAQPRS